MNTYFQQPLRRLYTWKCRDEKYRNQIDYLIINRRYKNNVKTCYTYPGGYINSDHCFVDDEIKTSSENCEKANKQNS